MHKHGVSGRVGPARKQRLDRLGVVLELQPLIKHSDFHCESDSASDSAGIRG